MEKEIEALFRKNRRYYVQVMSSILRGDWGAAEDVVQEAFCRALYYQDSFDKRRAKLATWFNKILFNALRDVQKEGRITPAPLNLDYSSEDLFEEMDLKETVEFHNHLSERIGEVRNDYHQRILILFFINGYTSREISEVEEKTSVSNVTTIVGRFRLAMLEN